jgi:RNA polymerase-interacting CarD/CdnL/TRCF family regulator
LFDVGDNVVYPHHGAGTVVSKDTRVVLGQEREYLTIKILHNDMTVNVPTENAEKVGLRWVIGLDAVEVVVKALSGESTEMPKNWNRRFKHNRDKMKTGDILELAEVVRNLATHERLVLDARMPERYRGEQEPIDPVAGHIPGARNRPWQRNLNPDQTFKSPQMLRQEFEAALGAVAAGQVVHQCGSGVTACHNLLAMEIAGLPGSALYAGSWSEWIADPARPVATGDEAAG